ncbi:hypothetical protein HMPREF9523_02191, partial [Enterococcus faecium TX0133A]
LLPQMQAFEHHLFRKMDCDKIFVTVFFLLNQKHLLSCSLCFFFCFLV